jgi:uncharacterized protein YigE (DUF2233 family)
MVDFGIGAAVRRKEDFRFLTGHLTGFARLFRDGVKCPNALFLDGGSGFELVLADTQSLRKCLAARPHAGRIRNK